MEVARQVLAIAILAVFAWSTYGRLLVIANRISRPIVTLIQPTSIPFRDACGIAVLPAWFLVIATVYVALALVWGLPLATLFSHSNLFDVPKGILLGVGEASVTIMLAGVMSMVLAPLRRRRGGDPDLEHEILGQSGWMRTYQYPLVRMPLPIALVVVELPLVGEELVFRAAGITMLLPMGLWPAVAISTALFMVVQRPNLLSWYQAVGPMCGAFVLGIVHALLFAREPNLLPLLIAHLTFFCLIAITPKPTRRPRAGRAVAAAVRWRG
jgi:hypothetical protein